MKSDRAESAPPPPPSVDIDVGDVSRRHGERAIQLVDIREPYEVAAGRIAGAAHIALSELGAARDLLETSRPVVFYCRVGGRSEYAAHAFRQAGYDAWSMAGGLRRWVQAGLPIVPEDGHVADH